VRKYDGEYSPLQVILQAKPQVLSPSKKKRKAAISFVMATCRSVDMEQLGSQWVNSREILNLEFLLTPVGKTKICLKSVKNKIIRVSS
jgi:hypothetical protein